MRIKRLLCVCAALALLLSVPARAAEGSEAPEAGEEIVVDIPRAEVPVITEETSETPEVPDTPENSETPEDPESPEVPETPEVPENPETPEAPEIPETPEAPETPPEEDESPAPAEDEELPEEDESPEEVGEDEEAEEAEEEAEEPEEESEVESEEESPVIHVVVPDTGRVIVNPYGMEVNMDGMISTDQIVSAPMPIVSYSSVPVAVVASVTGHTSPGSSAVFVPSEPRSDAKEIFMFAEFQPALDAYGSAFWSGQYTGAPNQLVVTADGSPAAQVLELAAGDEVPSCGAFHLFGSVSGSPEEMWSAEDAIHVTFTFTFVPLA